MLQSKQGGLTQTHVTNTRRHRLHMAAASGNAGVVQALVEAGADVDATTTVFDDTGGETPLHAACTVGATSCVRALLDADADIELAAQNGKTPLLVASECPQGLGVVKLLLSEGADVAAVTVSGKTALFNAVERGYTRMVAALLEAGSDPNQPTRRGKIPLYAAAENRCGGMGYVWCCGLHLTCHDCIIARRMLVLVHATATCRLQSCCCLGLGWRRCFGRPSLAPHPCLWRKRRGRTQVVDAYVTGATVSSPPRPRPTQLACHEGAPPQLLPAWPPGCAWHQQPCRLPTARGGGPSHGTPAHSW